MAPIAYCLATGRSGRRGVGRVVAAAVRPLKDSDHFRATSIRAHSEGVGLGLSEEQQLSSRLLRPLPVQVLMK